MNQRELLELYNRGIINLDVYFESLRNLKRDKSKRVELNLKLSEKLGKEYDDFCKEIMTKDKQEVFDRADEIAIKGEIKNTLEELDLFDEEKEVIISQDNVLSDFYNDWIHSSTPLGDVLRCSLEDTIKILMKYKKKENIEYERK